MVNRLKCWFKIIIVMDVDGKGGHLQCGWSTACSPSQQAAASGGTPGISGQLWAVKKLSEAFDVKMVFLDLSDPQSRKCVSAGIQIFTLDLVERILTWNFRFVKEMCRIILIVIGTHDKPWSLRGEFIIMTSR